MLQIDNHKELAYNDIIPYLLQFDIMPNLVSISGDRSQIIEDVIWKLLRSLDYTTANGIWLDYIGNKLGQNRIYTPKPTNAFTFGGTSAEGFGAGKFNATSSIRSTKIARTDSSFRNAIKSKIIQNNTDTSLDELIEACKLLFDAKLVRITEQYPAGIDKIDIYGSGLLETLDAVAIIKNAIPAGVSLGSVIFHRFYNLFKNNAFITYPYTVPNNDDFELSITIVPDELSPTETIGLFSQDSTFSAEFPAMQCYYNPTDGITFKTAPSYYNDSNASTTYYTDGLGNKYVDSDASVVLNGGSLGVNTNTTLTILKTGTLWEMKINGITVDSEISNYQIATGSDYNFYLGLAENKFYNSGSIYNFYLRNNTKNIMIVNDPLKVNTIGINNGVRFL